MKTNKKVEKNNTANAFPKIKLFMRYYVALQLSITYAFSNCVSPIVVTPIYFNLSVTTDTRINRLKTHVITVLNVGTLLMLLYLFQSQSENCSPKQYFREIPGI